MESTSEMETALQFYEAARDNLSLVRVYCYCGNLEKVHNSALRNKGALVPTTLWITNHNKRVLFLDQSEGLSKPSITVRLFSRALHPLRFEFGLWLAHRTKTGTNRHLVYTTFPALSRFFFVGITFHFKGRSCICLVMCKNNISGYKCLALKHSCTSTGSGNLQRNGRQSGFIPSGKTIWKPG